MQILINSFKVRFKVRKKMQSNRHLYQTYSPRIRSGIEKRRQITKSIIRDAELEGGNRTVKAVKLVIVKVLESEKGEVVTVFVVVVEPKVVEVRDYSIAAVVVDMNSLHGELEEVADIALGDYLVEFAEAQRDESCCYWIQVAEADKKSRRCWEG